MDRPQSHVNIFVIGKPETGKTRLVNKAKSIVSPRLCIKIFDVNAINERQILELLNDAYVNDTVPNIHNKELHGVILTSRADSIDRGIGTMFHAIKELLGHRFPVVLFFTRADVATEFDLEFIRRLSSKDAIPEPIDIEDIYYNTHPVAVREIRAAVDRIINKRQSKK